MATFLETQLEVLERELVAPNASEVEDLIAFHVTALDRLETRMSPNGLSEQDRPLVPLYRRWLDAAGKVKELAKGLRNRGETVHGYDELLRAMNRSKPVAESFDYFVGLNNRLAGEPRATGGAEE